MYFFYGNIGNNDLTYITIHQYQTGNISNEGDSEVHIEKMCLVKNLTYNYNDSKFMFYVYLYIVTILFELCCAMNILNSIEYR